jgi:hypothetical protein
MAAPRKFRELDTIIESKCNYHAKSIKINEIMEMSVNRGFYRSPVLLQKNKIPLWGNRVFAFLPGIIIKGVFHASPIGESQFPYRGIPQKVTNVMFQDKY